MSNAVNGVGTTIKRWSGSAWVSIAEVKSISGPGMTRDTIDVTTLDSTGGYREFIAGFRNAGTVGLSMNFTRAGFDIMQADFESDELQNYEIVLSDAAATSIEFEGLITEFPLSVGVGEAITMEVKIQISNAIVVGSGGSESPT